MATTTTQGTVQSLENSEQISRIPGHTEKMVKSRISNLITFYNLLLNMNKNHSDILATSQYTTPLAESKSSEIS